LEAPVLFYFIPLTVVFLIGFGVAALYLCMGSLLLAKGYKEKSSIKINRGTLAITISLPLAFALVYFYIEWIWL